MDKYLDGREAASTGVPNPTLPLERCRAWFVSEDTMEADDEDDEEEEEDDHEEAGPDQLTEAGVEAGAAAAAAADASAGLASDEENTDEIDETSDENDQPPDDAAGGGGGGADDCEPTEALSYADDEPERVRLPRLLASSDESERRARDGSPAPNPPLPPPLCESGNKDKPDPTPDMEPGREPEPDADKDGGGALPPNANETRRLPVAAPLRNAASSSSNAPTTVSAKPAPARPACTVPAPLGISEKKENSLSNRGS